MSKKLSEMNDVELGKLFPIILSKHNPEWVKLYLLEKERLENIVGVSNIVNMSHYGSTAEGVRSVRENMSTGFICSLLKIKVI